MKYHIEPDTVQETLVIPLFARLICTERFPALFEDENARIICDSLDYDFSAKRKLMESPAGLFGALEAAQRQYDLMWEVKDYLKDHPCASVVNLGCGLDDTFARVNNGQCHGYNLDFADVIEIREKVLQKADNEENIACDLNDVRWMDQIDRSQGVVFFAAGVFYYFETVRVRALFHTMAEQFPGGVLVFDACNARGAKMMRKTWLKQAGIRSVDTYFSTNGAQDLRDWSPSFANVSEKSYMRGYRDLMPSVSLFHRILILFCDHAVKMKIIRIEFRQEESEDGTQ
ncbi:MAG: class I SAM-dependent methyltransferase [Solobacterium sp.]|nr:class I SAM-dependent methyltransferase [Solobacterium sp.]